jgi:hypothetical protein
MKKTIFTLAFVFSFLITFAQIFEGKIIYQNTYKSKVPSLSTEQLALMMGSVQNYYIKAGDYKSETNGKLILWQIYINKDNKLYNKLSNYEAILWNDGAINTDAIISTQLHKGVADILGYKCDELILDCKSGIQKYYFTSSLAVDTKLYSNHLFGNWYAYLSQANAIPLKIIIENPQFTLESVATEVKSMKLDKAIFELPEGTKTAKSPY